MFLSTSTIKDMIPLTTFTGLITGRPTFKQIWALLLSLYSSASMIPTTARGGTHGHLGAIMDAQVYFQKFGTA